MNFVLFFFSLPYMSSESQTNRGRMESSFPFHRQKTEAWSTKQTKKQQQQKPCQPFTAAWMDLEATMLSEINQRKIYCMVLSEKQKNQAHRYRKHLVVVAKGRV